jgi:hypothetical protein
VWSTASSFEVAIYIYDHREVRGVIEERHLTPPPTKPSETKDADLPRPLEASLRLWFRLALLGGALNAVLLSPHSL